MSHIAKASTGSHKQFHMENLTHVFFAMGMKFKIKVYC